MIAESYLKGVSTRKVESVISELGVELSHATVSNLSHELIASRAQRNIVFHFTSNFTTFTTHTEVKVNQET